MIHSIWQQVQTFFNNYPFISWIKLVLLMAAAWIFFLVTRKIILKLASGAVEKTRNQWDDYLFENGFFNRISLYIPLIAVYSLAGWISDYEGVLKKICQVGMVLITARVLSLFLEALLMGLQKRQGKGRSISGIMQAGKLIIYLLAFILSTAMVMERSPLALLSGIGAMTAIITLVFKDTILSLVASIQFSLNKTLKVGDWIEVPEAGADGDVVDITLHNVMVQNWDKTLITIPTHKFLEQGFKNWKGMADAGGRRIKRSLLIDLRSVEFLEKEGVDKLRKIRLLKDYLDQKEEEIDSINKQHPDDQTMTVNGRNFTNLGIFRKYAELYLKAQPGIRQDMTLMVRQLEPRDRGVPLEIYCFTNDTAWINYESIQADIFDHLIAAVPWFGLRLYQNPSGGDLAGWLAPDPAADTPHS